MRPFPALLLPPSFLAAMDESEKEEVSQHHILNMTTGSSHLRSLTQKRGHCFFFCLFVRMPCFSQRQNKKKKKTKTKATNENDEPKDVQVTSYDNPVVGGAAQNHTELAALVPKTDDEEAAVAAIEAIAAVTAAVKQKVAKVDKEEKKKLAKISVTQHRNETIKSDTISQVSSEEYKPSSAGNTSRVSNPNFLSAKSTLKTKEQAWIDPWEPKIRKEYYTKGLDTLRPTFKTLEVFIFFLYVCVCVCFVFVCLFV